MKNTITVFVLLLFAGNAGAYVDAGARFTFGPGGYAGMNGFGEAGNDDYYLRPGLNTYESDTSDRRTTYSIGAGLDRPRWRAGAELSAMPETGGYENSGLYADLGLNLIGEPGEDAALENASVGVFAGLISHEDAYSLSTTTALGKNGMGTAVTTLTTSFKLVQTDYGLTAAVKAYGLRLSGRFAKTIYDKDITALDRQLPVDIGGIGASGFPDTAVSVRLRCPGLPLAPEAGYSKSSYLLDQPDSESVSLGISAEISEMIELSASWENLNPGGGAVRDDYYSAGLSLSF